MPGWAAGVKGALPRLLPVCLGNTGNLCFPCLPPPQRGWTESREEAEAAAREWAQREVMSLSALSSSSLMALYFIFCA